MRTLFSKAGVHARLAVCAAFLSGCVGAVPTVESPLRVSACSGGAEASTTPSSAYLVIMEALAAQEWELVDAQEETGFVEGRKCLNTQCVDLIFQIDQVTGAVEAFVPEREKVPLALAVKWIEKLDAAYDKKLCRE